VQGAKTTAGVTREGSEDSVEKWWKVERVEWDEGAENFQGRQARRRQARHGANLQLHAEVTRRRRQTDLFHRVSALPNDARLTRDSRARVVSVNTQPVTTADQVDSASSRASRQIRQ
jgi:hypothetical protein